MQDYAAWLEGAKKRFAQDNVPNPNMIAAAGEATK